MILTSLYLYIKHPFNQNKRLIYKRRHLHEINKKIFNFISPSQFFLYKIKRSMLSVFRGSDNKLNNIYLKIQNEDFSKKNKYYFLANYINSKELIYVNQFFSYQKKNTHDLAYPENVIIFDSCYCKPIYLKISRNRNEYDFLLKTIMFLYIFENMSLEQIYLHIEKCRLIKLHFISKKNRYKNDEIKISKFSDATVKNILTNINGFTNIFSYGRFSIFWINLGKQNSRRKHMENFFSIFQVDAKRIPAIDGIKLSARCSIATPELPSELGCFCSHIKAFKKFVKNNIDDNEYALILEDDISLDNQFFVDETITEIVGNAPIDWEILVLGYSNRRKLLSRYEPWDGALSGAFSYLIKRSAAKKILKKFKFSDILEKRTRKEYISDIYLYKNLKTYFYCNKIFITENFNSTISNMHYDSHLAARSIEFNHD